MNQSSSPCASSNNTNVTHTPVTQHKLALSKNVYVISLQNLPLRSTKLKILVVNVVTHFLYGDILYHTPTYWVMYVNAAIAATELIKWDEKTLPKYYT